MADIINQQALNFCDQKVRVMADLLEATVETARRIVDEWNATNMISLIPNNADLVRDAANPLAGNADGRKPITGAMANNIISRAFELMTDYEANGEAKLTTVKQVSVNGNSKF
jgi:hypothetical protein